MKIIINAEPEDMEYAMSLVVESFKTFALHPEKIGWGWNFGRPGMKSFFIRRTKGGFSASPAGKGAVALVSARGVRDIEVDVHLEAHPKGSMTPEETNFLTSFLRLLIGDDAITLMSEGAVNTRVKNSEMADDLVTTIGNIAANYEDTYTLNAWRV